MTRDPARLCSFKGRARAFHKSGESKEPGMSLDGQASYWQLPYPLPMSNSVSVPPHPAVAVAFVLRCAVPCIPGALQAKGFTHARQNKDTRIKEIHFTPMTVSSSLDIRFQTQFELRSLPTCQAESSARYPLTFCPLHFSNASCTSSTDLRSPTRLRSPPR